MVFRSRRRRDGGAAVAEPPGEQLAARHRAGIELVEQAGSPADQPSPDFGALPEAALPEVDAARLTPGLLRAAILRHGSLLVRGLAPRDAAAGLAAQMESAFAERANGAGRGADALYAEFAPEFPFQVVQRGWVEQTNAMWLLDSPPIATEVLELFRRAGMRELIADYLGEPAALSLQKSTLRKVEPDAPNAWHQDGAFMGDVRALNVWLSLSRCGDEAPGIDVVPRRLEQIVPTGTEGAMFDWSVAQDVAEEAAGEAPIVRPVFEPGDALLFDELCLHNTAAEPQMPNPRHAVETWFFGASSFPADYAPLAF